MASALRTRLSEDVRIPQARIIRGTKTVLMNERRLRIFEFIFNNPGTEVRRLSRELTLSLSTLQWHLGALESGGLVVSSRAGNRRVYSSPLVCEADETEVRYWLDSRCKDLIATLAKGQAAMVGELGKILGLSGRGSRYVLKTLIEKGLLDKHDSAYSLSVDARRLMSSYMTDEDTLLENVVKMLESQSLRPEVVTRARGQALIQVDVGRQEILTLRLSPRAPR